MPRLNWTVSDSARLFADSLSSFRNGQFSQAERGFRALLRHEPDHGGALNLLGVLLSQLGRFAEAEPVIRRAVDITPTSDATFYNYGLVLKSLGRLDEALEAFARALALNPKVAETWNNRGTVFNALARYEEAIRDFDQALLLMPNYAEACCNKGSSLLRSRRCSDALQAFDAAIKIGAARAEAWQGRGDALAALGRHNDAIAAFAKAVAIKPDYAEAYCNAGGLLARMGRHKEAIAAFEAALRADPNIDYAAGELLYAKAHICDWAGLTEGWSRVIDSLRERNAHVCPPFAFLLSPATAADQRRCAAIYAANRLPPVCAPRGGVRQPRDRLRIAYLSGDFREHAVGRLLVNVFEQHDRTRFETIALSCRPAPGAIRERFVAASDRFIDVDELSDPELAKLIRELEIDIAVDLSGYTTGTRTAVLAQRPAPLQVSYLGYPGTMGADFIDYVIADPFLIPAHLQRFYSEKVAYLDNYQPSDSARFVARPGPTRAECGLPEHCFVFCSFNNVAKITPEVFAIWMRLLQRVENSVLWLYGSNGLAVENLRKQAQLAEIEPQRIVFASFAEPSIYLARLQLADLFLDTFPYNAGATCNDALFVGLPVLTCAGETYVSRMAGSLLTGIGAPDLITDTLREYESKAIELARDPAALAQLRAKLAENRLRSSLFNIEIYTRQLEAAYEVMWQHHEHGQSPETFGVSAPGHPRRTTSGTGYSTKLE